MVLKKRNHKPNRLPGYDYSNPGYYFITLNVKEDKNYLGKIVNGRVELSWYGRVAHECWVRIPEHYENVFLDMYSFMPNHIHGIVVIHEIVRNAHVRSLHPRNVNSDRTKMLLSKVIQGFKSSVTCKIRRSQPGITFGWQKSFYDHVIRSERSLRRIKRYIIYNPMKLDLLRL